MIFKDNVRTEAVQEADLNLKLAGLPTYTQLFEFLDDISDKMGFRKERNAGETIPFSLILNRQVEIYGKILAMKEHMLGYPLISSSFVEEKSSVEEKTAGEPPDCDSEDGWY